MSGTLRGRAFKFGDNVNSDVIIPGRYLIHIDPETLSQHAFEVLGDEFPKKLRGFEILVAGENFGCGSAREQAVTAIQGLGIKAVIASSFPRVLLETPSIGAFRSSNLRSFTPKFMTATSSRSTSVWERSLTARRPTLFRSFPNPSGTSCKPEG